MTEINDNTNDKLLLMLQEGIPFAPHPLAVIGSKLGLNEEDVVKKIQGFFETGKARRFGAVFDSHLLGYRSTLCGTRIEPENIDRIAASLVPYRSITHCYRRECLSNTSNPLPNLWFTVTARADLYEKELSSLEQTLAPVTFLVLPAIKRFKIQVILDPRLSSCNHPNIEHHAIQSKLPADSVQPLNLSDTEKEVIRQLQENLSLTIDPVKAIASKTGLSPMTIVGLLLKWKESGALRRIGLILYHQKIGFKANAMCTWKVPANVVEEKGKYLAEIESVTHCYERLLTESFPYNLYAMIHAGNEGAIRSIFRDISVDAGLTDGIILESVKEYKKTSPRFFCE